MLKGIIHHAILISVVVISMMMIYSSMLKFVDPMWGNQFAVWGYSTAFLYAIAAYELIVGILVFARPTRLYGIIGLLILLAGALYTHISNHEYEELATAIFLVGLSTAVLIMMWMEKKMENQSK